jgi:hypothetical protein
VDVVGGRQRGVGVADRQAVVVVDIPDVGGVFGGDRVAVRLTEVGVGLHERRPVPDALARVVNRRKRVEIEGDGIRGTLGRGGRLGRDGGDHVAVVTNAVVEAARQGRSGEYRDDAVNPFGRCRVDGRDPRVGLVGADDRGVQGVGACEVGSVPGRSANLRPRVRSLLAATDGSSGAVSPPVCSGHSPSRSVRLSK